MPNPNTSILIVSESEAGTFLLKKILREARYTNVKHCEGAVAALQFLENNPTHILLVEWDMEEMDGVEMVTHLREIERDRHSFTYTVLIHTDQPGEELNAALHADVDSLVGISDITTHLVPQLRTATRISNQINELLTRNHELEEQRSELEVGQLLDPLTRLGNRRQAEYSLADTIRQIESRGGAVCFILINVGNYREIVETYDENIAKELIIAVSERIHHLVRPLDIVTYYDTGLFALILHQPNIAECTAKSYRRIFDGVRLKSYSTSVGFLSARIGMSLCASEAETGPPKAESIINTAEGKLDVALLTGDIQVTHLIPGVTPGI